MEENFVKMKQQYSEQYNLLSEDEKMKYSLSKLILYNDLYNFIVFIFLGPVGKFRTIVFTRPSIVNSCNKLKYINNNFYKNFVTEMEKLYENGDISKIKFVYDIAVNTNDNELKKQICDNPVFSKICSKFDIFRRLAIKGSVGLGLNLPSKFLSVANGITLGMGSYTKSKITGLPYQSNEATLILLNSALTDSNRHYLTSNDENKYLDVPFILPIEKKYFYDTLLKISKFMDYFPKNSYFHQNDYLILDISPINENKI